MNIFRKKLNSLSLRNKISLAYSFIMLSILLITMLATCQICYNQLSTSIDISLSNAAIMTAKNPEVIRSLKSETTSTQLKAYCDSVLKETNNLDVVTICNSEGIRIYHRNHSNIGQQIVGGDEDRMIEKHQPYFNTAYGTLGLQRRYFHGVFDEKGNFIGFVCTSVLMKNLTAIKDKLLLFYFLTGILALLASVYTAAHLQRQLKALLLGYEPEEAANMIIRHQEVLDSLEEGLLAIDEKSCVTLINSAACKLLDIQDPHPLGKPVLEIFPSSLLPRTLQTRIAEHNVNLKLNEVHLLTSRIPVIEQGHLLGAVSIFRDKTQVAKLSEQLTGVNHMVEAMRAYTHEFTNKLHVILGLIQCGNIDKATEYILHVTTMQKTKISLVMTTMKLPILCALLIGKICRANELNISLEIDHNSYVDDANAFLSPDTVTTIVGNLLQNAIDSINMSNAPVREIQLALFYDVNGFYFTVSDTGPGIPAVVAPHIFENGYSTKGKNRGTGLFLVKDVVDSLQGSIQFTTEEGNGTIFTVSIKNPTKRKEKSK